MTLLDRYIARQFITNVVLLLVLLFAVVVVIDFSLNFDEFTDLAEKLIGQRGWSDTVVNRGLLAVTLVADLWWPRLFQLFHYMAGLVMVGAMGFTCVQFVRHRELVAILAGGISLHRVIRPLVIVAVVLTGVQLADTEIALPRLAPLLTRDKTDAGKHEMGAARVPLTADGRGRLLYARSFDFDREMIEGLWVWERDAQGLMTRRIRAASAHWENGVWVLTEGVAEERRAGTRAGEPARPVEVRSIETDLDPTALRLKRFEGYSSNLSMGQITGMLERLRSLPVPPVQRIEQLERIRSGRVAAMACNLLTLLICTPFFVRREPVNMIVQSLYCAPVAVVALVGGLLGSAAAIPGLPAAVGPFVPVMVLIPVAIAALVSVRT
jgi:lipopolysaccharide export system permease protein